ncbi:hypothetical protein WJX73_003580 [Symbiochloris irregularis]|uniref:3-dehydroquinate synthase n=1 Tax=Symbiochloris irregularis TaxID=706552 RepID=A0AAW1P698_9CHLO
MRLWALPRVSTLAGTPSLSRQLLKPRARRCCVRSFCQSPVVAKPFWVQTEQKGVLTAALEAGVDTFIFDSSVGKTAQAWQALARFRSLSLSADGVLKDDESQEQIGQTVHIESSVDIRSAGDLRHAAGHIIMDAPDWQIIPAENLVAAFQGGAAKLMGLARSAEDGILMLEALEAGTHGVVLRTDSAAEVRALAAYLKRKAAESLKVQFEEAVVVRVQQAGTGDRVCVDLCSNMVPGEGMLVGSFARALFLVHSECAESSYINSRPFRVNAGPVHAYVAAPEGRTAYLSELSTGQHVLVADADGNARTAMVGRAKVEQRSLVLVEAETGDEAGHSSTPAEEDALQSNIMQEALQEPARHTGISIQEQITEK